MTKENQHGARCELCGEWCSEGEGRYLRIETDDGWRGVVRHRVCPQERRLEAAADVHRVEARSPEEVAYSTAVGRRWMAYWWLRGIRPTPAGVTVETIDEWIGNADVAEMDARVDWYRDVTLAGDSLQAPEWQREQLVRATRAKRMEGET